MIKAIFFDLDGTLLDTAPDLAFALNHSLSQRGMKTVSLPEFRPYIAGGTRMMVKFGFGIDESHPDFKTLQTEFLTTYSQNIHTSTQFFSGMENILNYLDEKKIPWGIITNKPAWLTEPLLAHFGIPARSTCIISGDTLPVRKPHPDPLLEACRRTQVLPQNTLYIGDTEIDILTAKAAGAHSMAVTYGYHDQYVDFLKWQADYVMHSTREILTWLRNW